MIITESNLSVSNSSFSARRAIISFDLFNNSCCKDDPIWKVVETAAAGGNEICFYSFRRNSIGIVLRGDT